MTDKLKLEEAIESRLHDDLWEKRIHQNVMKRVRSQKRRRLGTAAAIVLTLGAGSLLTTETAQTALASFTGSAPASSSTEETLSSQDHPLWGGFNKYPFQEDEELNIVMGTTF